ncbi:hypothetical protein GDO78_014346 [Eleutherodactylus coqui]|uniref:Uncharacterized protein n=1 Tax=Eleutherodactylus coqui TaxID=57060 RepID=A0A8J6JXN1_ELECQ|nr:hypothetical protein GDO78_014346 [Eleutherodactylus coqui]
MIVQSAVCLRGPQLSSDCCGVPAYQYKHLKNHFMLSLSVISREMYTKTVIKNAGLSNSVIICSAISSFFELPALVSRIYDRLGTYLWLSRCSPSKKRLRLAPSALQPE